jgi:hypothetical protein
MNKYLLALLALSVSALQAWDSNALLATGAARLLIAVGVLTPALAILVSRSFGVRLAAAGVSVLVLASARLVTDTHMPELMMAGAFPGILIFAAKMWPEAGR